ncbi:MULTISPECIES: HNH endonuclease [Nostocales]|uniref:HNH endonuclease n=3 Tax=Nostocales TaxID=1161 RepID=A0A0C1MX19_9CYAN|nr:HNH endonuclease signature motif containing protein [Tolypothrix bouteillei]KAF3889760.1 HNH endonuclease [Tolypothrix bouteillei VB521301]
MNPKYTLVSKRAGHRCEYCHAPELVFNLPFEVEHIIPLSKQGTDSEENLALACRSCNLHKSNRTSGVDPDSNTEVRLFHPRQDQWDDHFQVDATSGMIVGITAIGRTSVNSLEMNSQPQVTARQLWIRLGLFP